MQILSFHHLNTVVADLLLVKLLLDKNYYNFNNSLNKNNDTCNNTK